MNKIFCIGVLCFLPLIEVIPQEITFQTDFTVEEFQQRRASIYDAIGENITIIQGAEDVEGFLIFRQSNTFYYLTGLEVPSAYLLLDGIKRESTIYLPHRDPRRERSEGKKLSAEVAELLQELTGVSKVRPIEKMGTEFARAYLLRPQAGR